MILRRVLEITRIIGLTRKKSMNLMEQNIQIARKRLFIYDQEFFTSLGMVYLESILISNFYFRKKQTILRDFTDQNRICIRAEKSNIPEL